MKTIRFDTNRERRRRVPLSPRMRKHSVAHRGCRSLMVLLPLILVGCAPMTGLSPREIRGNDFSTLIYDGLPLEPAGDSTVTAQPLRAFPLNIGVIQAGEVGPAPSMVNILRAQVGLIARAEPLPGIYDGDDKLAIRLFPTADSAKDGRDHAACQRRAVYRMRALAADMGLDYLFLMGGTIDANDTDTPWAIMNLTIAGMYLFPSRQEHADAHAAGALIDLHTGRVVMTVDFHAQTHCIVPCMSAQAGFDGIAAIACEKAEVGLAKELEKRLEQARPTVSNVSAVH